MEAYGQPEWEKSIDSNGCKLYRRLTDAKVSERLGCKLKRQSTAVEDGGDQTWKCA
ncbi:hypothetical protein MU1_31530 [Paenibacillus glycanilyticus]|uniref:Uncharacterized protein n=1 Tax=Paenibacillus glycanilyticus TaxID=126569 RepID=A0ABQ6GHJ6_9BACL|nr:hypothetical protein MU1_31530 [Paenibacillus glycanilyticus]